MKRIVTIAELGVDDIPIAGGKAANLGERTSAGFNVPGGFVPTTAAYDYFLEKNHLPDEIEGGHCPALSRPQELAGRLLAYVASVPVQP